jgi:hypothetical protein
VKRYQFVIHSFQHQPGQSVDPSGLDVKIRLGPIPFSFTLSLHSKFDGSVEFDGFFLRYDSRPSHIHSVKNALIELILTSPNLRTRYMSPIDRWPSGISLKRARFPESTRTARA